MNTFKKLLAVSVVAVGSIVISNNANAVAPCAKNSLDNITDNTSCYAPSDSMYFSVTRVMLCTAAVSAPTPTSPADTSSCKPFYSSAGSSAVQVMMGQSSFPGQVVNIQTLLPGPGGYTFYRYAYIESEPSVSLKTISNFTANRTAVDGSTGSTCWTKDATVYTYASSAPTNSASCGSSTSATPGVTKVLLNSLSSGSPVMSHTSQYTGVSTYLVDSSGKLVAVNVQQDTMGAVSKMINIQRINYTATWNTKGINANVSIKTGAWVQQSGNLYFLNGDAAMNLTSR